MALRYPETIGEGNSKDWIKFQFYQYKSPFQSKTGKDTSYVGNLPIDLKTPTGQTICMLMPQDIGSSFSGAWGGKDVTGLAQVALGTIGAGAGSMVKGDFKQALQNVQQIFTGDTVKDVGGAGLTDLLDFFGSSFSQLPGMGANLTANDVLQLTNESIVNPNTELLYGGTGLRTHSYNFKMIAQSSGEADNILNIVKQFKQACAPKKKAPAFGGAFPNFIGVPDLCQISFMNGQSVNTYLPQYKLSGITSVNVNYVTDGTFISYVDGKPLGVSLTIGLTETKLVFSDEIERGVIR